MHDHVSIRAEWAWNVSPLLQEEIEATGQKYVMYRPIIRSLIEAVGQQEVRQLLLDGMPGAGKSVALSLLAQWARQKGWVVCMLPVPLASVLYCCVTCLSMVSKQTPMQHPLLVSHLAAQIKLYVREVCAKC